MAASARPPSRPILVILLHAPEEQPTAECLADIWQPAVPAAKISLASAAMDDLDNARCEVMARRAEAQVSARNIILVGTRGTEALALALAFDSSRRVCSGLLICGRTVPDTRPVSGASRTRRMNCRMVFGYDDEAPDVTAFGYLLRQLRSAGVNIRGAVFDAKSNLSTAGAGHAAALDGYAPSVVRMGGGYLAELVATALAMETGLSTRGGT